MAIAIVNFHDGQYLGFGETRADPDDQWEGYVEFIAYETYPLGQQLHRIYTTDVTPLDPITVHTYADDPFWLV